MADNYKQAGDNLTLIAPSGGVVSGTAYLIGKIFGVAIIDAAATETFSMATKGVWTLPKAGSQAQTAGAYLYWDDTNKLLTTTASGNTLCAKCVVAAGSSDTTVVAKIIDV